MRRTLAACWALALAACDAPPPQPAPTSAPPPATPTPPQKTATVATPPPTADAPLAGVGPGGAEGRGPRRQAVLDLLTDGRSAAALELAAVDPNQTFDPDLDDKLTPRARTNTIPGVLMRKATVAGPLDKDIVRRIVRAHINEVRYCYNQGLARDPKIGGIVTTEFTVLANGHVGDAAVLSSTVADAAVGTCIIAAIRRWTFPKPAGSVAKVTYPFELQPPGTEIVSDID